MSRNGMDGRQKTQAELLDKTQKIVEAWYHLDMQTLKEYMDEKVTWIGAEEGQYHVGLREVEEALKACPEKLLFRELLRQNFFVADAGKDFCIIMGTYMVMLDDPDCYISETQRLTSVWKNKKDRWWLTHIHISNVAEVVKGEEELSVRTGKAARQYIRQKLQSASKRIMLSVAGGTCRQLDEHEIYYLEGANEYTILHTRSGSIRIRKRMYKLKEELFQDFLIIHRCYYINPDIVRIVRRGEIVMQNGDVLPISRNRYPGVMKYFNGRIIERDNLPEEQK